MMKDILGTIKPELHGGRGEVNDEILFILELMVECALNTTPKAGSFRRLRLYSLVLAGSHSRHFLHL